MIIEEYVLIKNFVKLGNRVIISKRCILKNNILTNDYRILPIQ
ncbi:hypothetical protein GJU04_02000 [Enterobacteriaceae endosymbiont of Donacia marginata]|nr:hypothetical protein GJU04_02000 [Enterobacteriaceae endosymbiont of Donacia marginata]